MIDFRESVMQEAKRQDLSAYGLGKLAGLHPRSVQLFFSGQKDTTTKRLAMMLEALGLKLIIKRRKSARKRGAL